MKCPRCHSEDITESRCNACRIAYDSPLAFEPHTREHTMVSKRWTKWRTVDRVKHERARLTKFLGNG